METVETGTARRRAGPGLRNAEMHEGKTSVCSLVFRGCVCEVRTIGLQLPCLINLIHTLGDPCVVHRPLGRSVRKPSIDSREDPAWANRAHFLHELEGRPLCLWSDPSSMSALASLGEVHDGSVRGDAIWRCEGKRISVLQVIA